jgi:hypothetical protein
MPFKGSHVCFVSFIIKIAPAGTANVVAVETDLHLNSKHTAYCPLAVRRFEFLGDQRFAWRQRFLFRIWNRIPIASVPIQRL